MLWGKLGLFRAQPRPENTEKSLKNPIWGWQDGSLSKRTGPENLSSIYMNVGASTPQNCPVISMYVAGHVQDPPHKGKSLKLKEKPILQNVILMHKRMTIRAKKEKNRNFPDEVTCSSSFSIIFWECIYELFSDYSLYDLFITRLALAYSQFHQMLFFSHPIILSSHPSVVYGSATTAQDSIISSLDSHFLPDFLFIL